jgi:hypothetical protein
VYGSITNVALDDREFFDFLMGKNPKYLRYKTFVESVIRQVREENPNASGEELDHLFVEAFKREFNTVFGAFIDYRQQ